MRIHSDTIYLTDNGCALCGDHLGASARYTGRDLSGQPVMPVMPQDALYSFNELGHRIVCEDCGRPASFVHRTTVEG